MSGLLRLPGREKLGTTITVIIVLYLLKGAGAYLSGYLMTDVGQRVVRDLRNVLFTHILGQSAGVFAHGATGRLLSRINNDVGQVQHGAERSDHREHVDDGLGILVVEHVLALAHRAFRSALPAGEQRVQQGDKGLPSASAPATPN